MSKTLNKVMLSMSTMVIATGLIVGASYALFSDTVNVNNHLEAGSLSVGLKRTSFQENTLQADGTLLESPVNTDVVDLTLDNSNLFTFDKAVPTSWQKATVEVSNLGNVAFNYGVRMIFDETQTATTEQIEFAKQVKISITYGETITKSFMLNDAANNDVNMGTILANGAAQTFDVKAEFVDDANNNAVQTITLDFDMQVYATQKVN